MQRNGIRSTVFTVTLLILVAGAAAAQAPAITTQPISQWICSGSATFTVAASGSPTPTYRWYKGTPGSGTSISGATSASYSTSTANTYYCVATNSHGTATSNAATLSVGSTKPTISTLPGSEAIVSGGSVTLSLSINGSAPTYAWYEELDRNRGLVDCHQRRDFVDLLDRHAHQ